MLIFMAFYGFLIIVTIIIALLIFNNIHTATYTQYNLTEQLNIYRNILQMETFQNSIRDYLKLYNSSYTLNNKDWIYSEAKIDSFNIIKQKDTFIVSSETIPHIYWIR